MSKSPEAAEAAGFEVCEKETRDGRTVAYKTGRQLEKEKEAKSEKQTLRKEAGISAKGRISKANLAKLNELKAKLDSLKAIQVERENALESKIEEGHAKSESKKDETKKETKTSDFKVLAKDLIEPNEFTKGKVSWDFKKLVDWDGDVSKPYVANISLFGNTEKTDRKFEKYGSDILINKDVNANPTYNGFYTKDEASILGKDFDYSSLQPINIIEYRNASEDFKRFMAIDSEKILDVEEKDIPGLLKQHAEFRARKERAINEKIEKDGGIAYTKGDAYIGVDEDEKDGRSKYPSTWFEDGDIAFKRVGNVDWTLKKQNDKMVVVEKKEVAPLNEKDKYKIDREKETQRALNSLNRYRR